MSEFTKVLLYASTITPLARMGGSPQSTMLAREEKEVLMQIYLEFIMTNFTSD